jgi:hypothetical protein
MNRPHMSILLSQYSICSLKENIQKNIVTSERFHPTHVHIYVHIASFVLLQYSGKFKKVLFKNWSTTEKYIPPIVSH